MAVNQIPPIAWTGRNDPEDGAHALRLHHLEAPDAERAILGFASEAGVLRNKGRKGACEGPSALRRAMTNLAAPAKASNFSDLGDVQVDGDDLEAGQALLADRISSALGNVERLVVLGGGHETAFGSYRGLAQKFPDKQIGIVNLDAHLDLRLAGERGGSSGTPFAQIRDLAPDKFDYLCIGVAEESNTRALFDRAQSWNVHIVSDHALIKNETAADLEIDKILHRSDIIYLTIDIDVLPHYQAPGVSAPAARGVPLSTIEYLVRYILNACNKAGCALPLADIVELSPPNDPQNVTARSAALLVRPLLLS